MTQPDTDTLLAFAGRLADAAATETLKHFRQRLDVDDKAVSGKMDPVTIADRNAEQAIRRMIESEYPGHGIIGEEFPDRPGEGAFEWIIDPIDGTRAYVTGLPIWGTLIGLQNEGEPIVGVLDQPYIGERFSGGPNGSTLKTGQQRQKLSVSQCSSLAHARLATTTPEVFSCQGEFAAFERLVETVPLLRYGGDCYLYGMLAAGHIDLVVEASLKPFDIVALIPIITASGGVVTQWSGGPAQHGGRIVAAATPELHAEALEILNSGTEWT